MKDIIDKLKSMDKKELGEAVKAAKKFADTPEGQKLVEKLKNGETVDSFGIQKEQQGALKKQLDENPHIAKLIFDILNGKG